MQESELLWIIQSIDQQIANINPNKNSLFPLVLPLLELRNNILQKFQPQNNLGWHIQNKRALEIISKIDYIPIYESNNGNSKRYSNTTSHSSKTNNRAL